MKKNIYVVFEENVCGENDCSLFETYDKALEYFNNIKLEIKENEENEIENDSKNYFQWFDANYNEFSSSIQIIKKEIQ
jgi:hypothetical protein